MAKRKASRIVITRNGHSVAVEERTLRGNAQIERAKRIKDRLVRKHKLRAVFQR